MDTALPQRRPAGRPTVLCAGRRDRPDPEWDDPVPAAHVQREDGRHLEHLAVVPGHHGVQLGVRQGGGAVVVPEGQGAVPVRGLAEGQRRAPVLEQLEQLLHPSVQGQGRLPTDRRAE